MPAREITPEEEARMMEDVWDAGEQRVHIERPKWYGSYRLLFMQLHPAGRSFRYATGFRWSDPVDFNEPLAYDGETTHLRQPAAQGVFDQLWEFGFRPSQGGVSDPGIIEAMKGHLEDMRRLVFDLPAEEPE